jgi:DNA transposition AAA+ family ATPase
MTTESKQTVYTADDLEKVDKINAWLDANKQSRAWLGKKCSIPSGTLSAILNGKYASSPSKQLAQALSALAVEADRMSDGSPGFVRSSVYKLITVMCDRTRKYASFGVLAGHVGVGKTRSLNEYQASHHMTLLVETSPNMTPGVLLNELLAQINVPAPAGLDNKFRAVVRGLKGSNYLITVDEAERMSSNALEYLRRIRDMAHIGIVLVGTEKLSALIQPEHGQFDQIRSRVGMWPSTITAITRDDADDMARAALHDAGELADEVLDALWGYCKGSARVLMEGFVPGLRDFCMGKGALTVAHVDQVAKKVLFMQAPGRRAA